MSENLITVCRYCGTRLDDEEGCIASSLCPGCGADAGNCEVVAVPQRPVSPPRWVGVVEHYVLPALKVLLLIGGVALGIALSKAVLGL